MKKLIILSVIFLLTSYCVSAQNITVTSVSENLGEGQNPAFGVFIPYANAGTIEKRWISFLKDYRAKVKSSKDEITAQNFVLREKDTLQVFSRITEKDEGVMLSAAFSRQGIFISSENSQSDYDLISKMLHDFALPVAKDGIEKKIKEASTLLSAKEKERDNLVKRNEQLQNTNAKLKEQMNDNEREKNDNEKKIKDLKDEVDTQKSAVEEIRSKSKDID